jgi:hypothetical protein
MEEGASLEMFVMLLVNKTSAHPRSNAHFLVNLISYVLSHTMCYNVRHFIFTNYAAREERE